MLFASTGVTAFGMGGLNGYVQLNVNCLDPPYQISGAIQSDVVQQITKIPPNPQWRYLKQKHLPF